MYKLDIEELNINGEPEVVQSFYFEYSQKEEMFKCAFDCKRDYNKIYLDEIEILDDWKQGEPKIKSFDYRNYILTNSVCIDAMRLIEDYALFLHGEIELTISSGRKLLDTMKSIKEKIYLLEESIEEYEKWSKDK